MQKEQIENMIDKKIEKYLSEKASCKETILGMSVELYKMSTNMSKTLSKTVTGDGSILTVEHFDGIDFFDINPVRVRYLVHYIKHCKRRRNDLTWLLNKGRTLRKNNSEMFKLLKFKEKISI